MRKNMRKILIFGFGTLILYLFILMISSANVFQTSDNKFNIENEKIFADKTCTDGFYYSRGPNVCLPCNAGFSCAGGVSTSCKAGTYQDEKGKTSCKNCPDGQYQPNSGQSSCLKCDGTVTENGTKCVKKEISHNYVLSDITKLYLAQNETANKNLTIKENGENVKGLSLKVSGFDSDMISVYTTYNHARGIYVISVKSKSKEGETNVRVCAFDKCKTFSVKVFCSRWNKVNNSAGFSKNQSISYAYSNNWCFYFEKDENQCTEIKDSSGKVISYRCKSYYSRCCGEVPSELKACYKTSTGEYKWDYFKTGYTAVSGVEKEADCVTPAKACYINNSGEYKWDYYKEGYTKVEEITDELECEAPPEDVNVSCDSNLKPSPESDSVASCNGSVTVNLNTGKGCSSTVSGSYYNITCSPETIVTKFNPDDFSNPLFAGQGFSYNIGVTSRRTCNGSFDSKKWNEAYDKVTYGVDYYKKRMNDTKYSESKRREYASSYNEYLNKLKDLVNMVIDYNEYQNDILGDYSMTPVATMEIYKTKKVNGVITEEKRIAQPTFEEFKVTEFGSGTLQRIETYRLSATKKEIEKYGVNATGFANPIKFSYSNRNNPKSGEFNLAKTYINRTTGEISNISHAGDVNWIDAGNKYYTSMDLDSNYSYVIKINVSNLGTTKNLTVENVECEFRIQDNNEKLIYRHIDTLDPFINNTDRDTGTNWLNSKYDFRKIIKSSSAVLYKFNISKNTLTAIRKSNSLISGSEEYLGVCQNSLYSNDIVCKMLKGID